MLFGRGERNTCCGVVQICPVKASSVAKVMQRTTEIALFEIVEPDRIIGGYTKLLPLSVVGGYFQNDIRFVFQNFLYGKLLLLTSNNLDL